MDPTLQKGKIHTQLLRWFKKNGRDLPWRKTKDPYAIWVSEIMLQQTQVDTVIPYYQKFLKSFPIVHHLAKANLSKILKVWEGLGYYSRARNLHRASKIIVNHFQGKIPNNLRDLLSLPGIGRSTAGAILSFAYNKEAPILDGNVKRVLSRLFAISGSKAKTERLLWGISEFLIPKGRSNPFNQALMDLGSMLCTPKDPQCPHCPLQNFCKGKASGNPERYPTKGSKKKIPHINAISAVIKRDGKVLLNRRPPKGLLGGLWEFPNWKSEGRKNRRWLTNRIRNEMGVSVNVKELIGTFHQTFSHFKLTLHVYHCQGIDRKKGGRWVSFRELSLFPMSKLHRRIAQTLSKNPRKTA
ncbi:MAG: A/G-specific adenine glycosylase [Thermodesulfobacteriota bacterium]